MPTIELEECDNINCFVRIPKKDIRKCGNCRFNRYCSRKCQVEDWGRHKPECKERFTKDDRKIIRKFFKTYTSCKSHKCLSALRRKTKDWVAVATIIDPVKVVVKIVDCDDDDLKCKVSFYYKDKIVKTYLYLNK